MKQAYMLVYTEDLIVYVYRISHVLTITAETANYPTLEGVGS